MAMGSIPSQALEKSRETDADHGLLQQDGTCTTSLIGGPNTNMIVAATAMAVGIRLAPVSVPAPALGGAGVILATPTLAAAGGEKDTKKESVTKKFYAVYKVSPPDTGRHRLWWGWRA
jgi:hypothetical protein